MKKIGKRNLFKEIVKKVLSTIIEIILFVPHKISGIIKYLSKCLIPMKSYYISNTEISCDQIILIG